MTIAEAKSDAPENGYNAEQVLDLLRSIPAVGGQRDIVSAGFVKEIEVVGSEVKVVFAPNIRGQEKVERMESNIRDVLGAQEGIHQVDIKRTQPFSDDDVTDSRAHASERPDLAPEAGYGLSGPESLGGPSADTEYESKLPVFQWEIDPHDPSAKSGNADVTIGEWDFRMWWQEHESRLLYTSIQAMHDDDMAGDGSARSHPVGRMEAVNLVYDLDRKAVVAIYGTVRDFRPFVDAFYQSYVLRN